MEHPSGPFSFLFIHGLCYLYLIENCYKVDSFWRHTAIPFKPENKHGFLMVASVDGTPSPGLTGVALLEHSEIAFFFSLPPPPSMDE